MAHVGSVYVVSHVSYHVIHRVQVDVTHVCNQLLLAIVSRLSEHLLVILQHVIVNVVHSAAIFSIFLERRFLDELVFRLGHDRQSVSLV